MTPSTATRSACALFAASFVGAAGCNESKERVARHDAATTLVSRADSATAPVAVLNDWFALGSGCRAKEDLPESDVQRELLPADLTRPNVHRVRFHLERFVFHPEGPLTQPLARECAIRINVNPPPGMRLSALTARTRVDSTPAEGIQLTLHEELKIGSVSLGDRTTITTRTKERTAGSPSSEAVELPSSSDAGSAVLGFPALACAEPKIIGFDFTWLAERVASPSGTDAGLAKPQRDRPVRTDGGGTRQFDVRIGGPGVLDLEATLEPCPQ